MRGTTSSSSDSSSALNPETTSVPITSTTASSTPNLTNNVSTAQSPGSVVSWIVVFLVVAVWSGVRHSEKVETALEPNKILSALTDVFSIGLIAGVGLKGLHILFTKLAALDIPIISKISGFVLPIYS